MKAPLPIPAINNELEVMAIYLGIAADNDQERSRIVIHGTSKFEYKGMMYSVVNQDMYRLGTVVHTYNGNIYTIKEKKLPALH